MSDDNKYWSERWPHTDGDLELFRFLNVRFDKCDRWTGTSSRRQLVLCLELGCEAVKGRHGTGRDGVSKVAETSKHPR